jgi:hypothetical protein
VIRCDAPGCRSGVLHTTAFGEPCPTCKGRGELHLAEVARLLGENETTLKKLMKLRGRMRVRTCRRILDKVAKVVWPKQPELF